MKARFSGLDLSHKPPPPGETELWDRAQVYEWWLHRYGKTPTEVRSMPAWLVARIPGIAAARDEVISARQGG